MERVTVRYWRDGKSCAKCRYCHNQECRRNPPVSGSSWPFVDIHRDWCGEFVEDSVDFLESIKEES